MEDKQTVEYFDRHTPEFYVERYNFTVKHINADCPPGASLIDLGCGNGNVLEFIRQKTPVARLVGMDVSRNYLQQARERVGCETIQCSILDTERIAGTAECFDFALLGEVLHHLVGRTRRESRQNARLAIANALRLVKDGGRLFIIEPAFAPPCLMTVAFYVKKIFSRLSAKRLEMFKAWANIGPPVVSYYTNEEVVRMIAETRGAELADREIKDRMRLGLVIRKTRSTFVVRKE